MSKVETLLVDCPACGTATPLRRIDSLNAQRLPAGRAQILDNSLMLCECFGCGEAFRADPLFTYFDEELGLWINARPFDELRRWEEAEVETQAVHLTLFELDAPPAVAALGQRLTPRLTFGWAALREKILCRQHGLDDVTLELAKMAALVEAAGASFHDDAELRLLAVEGDTLWLGWLEGAAEQVTTVLELPRAALEDIEAQGPAWDALRAQVAGDFYVDMNRAIAA
ncbi:MAG: hypothetical protein H6741_24490 [Alphaproteobacteria bacterium]|nr:hypothetical protein [Alphaproteobacteria bacterium]